MNNINQTHFGSGDNVGGDKISLKKSKDKTFPIWAQWISWIGAILLVILAIYEFLLKI